MGNRGCFYFMFFLLIQRVSLENIAAVSHGTVILPCSVDVKNIKIDNIEIFWRHNDSRTVVDINGRTASFIEQHPDFLDRVDSFPKEYENGNFSIRLRDVKVTDSGMYSCNILAIQVKKRISLNVKEVSLGERADAGNGDVSGRPDGILLSFATLLGLFLLHP